MIWLASTLTEWIGAVGGGIAGAVAAFIAIWQLPEIKRAGKLSARANVSQSYAVVSERMSDLQDVLMENPDWIPYFYKNKDPGNTLGGADRAKLGLVCEAIADFADGLIEQRRTVMAYDPDAMDWSTWDVYFRFLYQNSPVLREALRENRDFYPDYVFSAFGYIIVRDAESGVLDSEWAVREWSRDGPDEDEGDPPTSWFDEKFGAEAGGSGYPWIRTWLIEKIADEEKDREPVLAVWTRRGESETAAVSFACYPDADPEQVLRLPASEYFPPVLSWVIGLLQASTRLRTVDVFLKKGAAMELYCRVPLEPPVLPRRLIARVAHPRIRRTPREGFLAPAIAIPARCRARR
jgi:hypothetical protein